MTSNDLESVHIELKMDLHEPLQKPGMNSGRVSSSCSTNDTRHDILVTKSVKSHE